MRGLQWITSLSLFVLALAACGSGFDHSIRITSSTINPNPVPAPSVNNPVTVSLALTVEASPELAAAGFEIGRRDPAVQSYQIIERSASYRFPCTQVSNQQFNYCSATSYALRCTVSSVPNEPSKRTMDCGTNSGPQTFEAGEYDFGFSANTPSEGLAGAKSDAVYGKIRFN
jgi:hypothetical protein